MTTGEHATTTFVGGSRHIGCLNEEMKRLLNDILNKGHRVVVGDAEGVDKAVQDYLYASGHKDVEVFCTQGRCRNNVGNWPVRAVDIARRRRDRRYYAAKDRHMADKASQGLMIWDGKSPGTLANVARLACAHKHVGLYIEPDGRTVCLDSKADWIRFAKDCPPKLLARVENQLRAEKREKSRKKDAPSETPLFDEMAGRTVGN